MPSVFEFVLKSLIWIERIKLDKKKSVIVKQSMMAEVRKSFAQRKVSSMKTVLRFDNLFSHYLNAQIKSCKYDGWLRSSRVTSAIL